MRRRTSDCGLNLSVSMNASMTSALNSSMSVSPMKPCVHNGKKKSGRDAMFGRLGNMSLNASLSSSVAKSAVAYARRGVQVCPLLFCALMKHRVLIPQPLLPTPHNKVVGYVDTRFGRSHDNGQGRFGLTWNWCIGVLSCSKRRC